MRTYHIPDICVSEDDVPRSLPVVASRSALDFNGSQFHVDEVEFDAKEILDQMPPDVLPTPYTDPCPDWLLDEAERLGVIEENEEYGDDDLPCVIANNPLGTYEYELYYVWRGTADEQC